MYEEFNVKSNGRKFDIQKESEVLIFLRNGDG